MRVKIKETKRIARLADTLEEQKEAEEEVQKLNRLQRRKRQELFDTEDEIEAKRDELIEALELKMHQTSSTHRLFRIHWQIV